MQTHLDWRKETGGVGQEVGGEAPCLAARHLMMLLPTSVNHTWRLASLNNAQPCVQPVSLLKYFVP